MFLVVDGTEPKMTVRIQKEFRHDLQVRIRFLRSSVPIMQSDGEGVANLPALV